MVADGLSIINADFSSTSFRVSRTTIGAHNFLGNHIAYPSQGRTGDNCLLGDEGHGARSTARSGRAWACSARPASRSRGRSSATAGSTTWPHRSELRRRLAAKNRHNPVTMGLYLLVRWLLRLRGHPDRVGRRGPLRLCGPRGDRAGQRPHPPAQRRLLRARRPGRHVVPRCCGRCSARSTTARFWRHERFWKVPAVDLPSRSSTARPFKNVIWRLLGVRIGRRVFDDGCCLTGGTLVTHRGRLHAQCGQHDPVPLAGGRRVQVRPHQIGAGCTLGVGAFVHYGVTIGDGAVLAPDSFLMKGEEVPPHARWGGNPAQRDARPRLGSTAGPEASTTTTAAPRSSAGRLTLAPQPVG